MLTRGPLPTAPTEKEENKRTCIFTRRPIVAPSFLMHTFCPAHTVCVTVRTHYFVLHKSPPHAVSHARPTEQKHRNKTKQLQLLQLTHFNKTITTHVRTRTQTCNQLNQLTTETVNQPNNKKTSQSTNQSISRPATQPTKQASNKQASNQAVQQAF